MEWKGLDEIGGTRVAPGLWRWLAYHPEWKQDVACAAVECAAGLILIDPLLPSGRKGKPALEGLAARAEPPTIVLTVFYHQRSAGEIMERIPGTALWVDERGVEKVDPAVTHPFAPGAELPGGIVAYGTARPDEVILWEPASRSLIVGDVILGRGEEGIELCPDGWLPDGVDRGDLARTLLPLLDLPVERVLPGHGELLADDARGALERIIEAHR